MQTLGLAALLCGTCAFLYPLIQEGFPLPPVSLDDARLAAGILLAFAGVVLLFRRRS
jgi:hypothetical protein